MSDKTRFSLFTKPWPTKSIDEIGRMAHWLGFDGIELPVRPGFPVHPENATVALPNAVKTLAKHNVTIFSVASTPDEAIIAACGEAGVPTLRVMAPIGKDGYIATEHRMRTEFDVLLPALERHKVRIGVQNHSGRYVCNAAGLRALVTGYDPKLIGVIWDAAHNALQGEEPELAIEIVWSHICMVNLKNAVWRRTNATTELAPQWSAHWVPGREGLASWPRVAAELKRRSYNGPVCLTAEYSEEAQVDRFIAEDLSYARSAFGDHR